MLAVDVVQVVPWPGLRHVCDLVDPGESADVDIPPIDHQVVRAAAHMEPVDASRCSGTHPVAPGRGHLRG
jgi:hypothetical protein